MLVDINCHHMNRPRLSWDPLYQHGQYDPGRPSSHFASVAYKSIGAEHESSNSAEGTKLALNVVDHPQLILFVLIVLKINMWWKQTSNRDLDS